jgi:hypothetical protein
MNPSLAMLPCAFDTGKLYSVLPDTGAGDFTVSRNGTATYIGSDGLLKTAQANEPRLEFNTDGSFRGVLVEPAATNLLQRSEQFENNVYWNKQQISATSNNSTAPNGAMTADKLIPDTTSNQHRIYGFANFSGQGVLSVYAKADGYNFISFGVSGGVNYSSIIFNLSNGTISGTSAGVTPTIQNQGNGWYRCSISQANMGGGIPLSYWVIVRDSNSTANYAGDGVSGVLVWGAQLEVGSVATSYIPTVATSITRPADIIQRTNAQDLIGQTEGTIYVEINISFFSTGLRIIQLSTGELSNSIEITLGGSNRFNFQIRINGVLNQIVSNSFPFGFYKIAASYKNNDYTFYINGQQIGSNTSINVPNGLNLIGLGCRAENNGSNSINNRIRSFTLFKTRLSNAQLQALTTL